MIYAWVKSKRVHILNDNRRTLCQVENGSPVWQPTISETFPKDLTLCANCWSLHRIPKSNRSLAQPEAPQ